MEQSQETVKIPKKRGRKPKNLVTAENNTIGVTGNITADVEKPLPKKRGRKPKEKKPEDDLPKIPKKRGRKPKEKTDNAETVPKKAKKRGRKPKEKYGQLNIQPEVSQEEENIILHLPINSQSVNFETSLNKDAFEYNPTIKDPSPYLENSQFQSPFETLPEQVSPVADKEKGLAPEGLETTTQNTTQNTTQISRGEVIAGEDTPLDNNTAIQERISTNRFIDNVDKTGDTLPYQDQEVTTGDSVVLPLDKKDRTAAKQRTYSSLETFKETNKKKETPLRTSIYCWWCCHPFETKPVVLPTDLIEEEFKVEGCFCCPECAAAYNHANYHQHAERSNYNLLNMLYKRFNEDSQIPIKLAPPKLCLRIFGGNLSIEEFRQNCSNYYQEFTTISPPMISIIPQIEENQVNFGASKKKYIPLDQERIEKANEVLKLQRKKPLSETHNTLEQCMKLSYQREEN